MCFPSIAPNANNHSLWITVWKQSQEQLITSLKEKGIPLMLAGDGRSDSPGHSAKYGSYSILELTCNKIIDFKLVQVSTTAIYVSVALCFLQSNEVSSSNNMEKEGLQRVLQFLDENGLQVGALVTDRHQQITKWIREQHPNITHYYDVWHVAKGML